MEIIIIEYFAATYEYPLPSLYCLWMIAFGDKLKKWTVLEEYLYTA